MKWLKDVMTEADNQTTEWTALFGGIMIVSFVGFAAWHIWQTHKFDPISYGTGGASLLGGGGLSRFLKRKAGDYTAPPAAADYTPVFPRKSTNEEDAP